MKLGQTSNNPTAILLRLPEFILAPPLPSVKESYPEGVFPTIKLRSVRSTSTNLKELFFKLLSLGLFVKSLIPCYCNNKSNLKKSDLRNTNGTRDLTNECTNHLKVRMQTSRSNRAQFVFVRG
jgi:hypothetical protein